MIIFKCKMCGGDLHPADGATTCECEYCGSVQTIPTADNEKKMNLFARAQRLLRSCEFDKAAGVYESIVAEFQEEAEAYWGLCLCKYGIEYVDDPATGRKIPTCHRTRPESILDDADFDQACEYADAVAKRVYREEAKAIDRLQQDILSVVANESPYDVFICYKETGEDGERTEDSVLAQDIHDALTAKGLKVFFARITLEDKLGQQYEPYIYAALHSAKVMLAVGTEYEHFDAVWVKNEWARFLDMMKGDKSKTLIPCYKGIDAYDMPREFKNLQAQDMGKLGWLQDLTRGVMKLCGKDEQEKAQPAPVVQQVIQSGSPTAESLLKRAFAFAEDGQWDNVNAYIDKVLDIDVENGQAYLAKLLLELKVNTPEELMEQKEPFDQRISYQKLMRYGDDELKRTIEQYSAVANENKRRIEKELQEEQQRILDKKRRKASAKKELNVIKTTYNAAIERNKKIKDRINDIKSKIDAEKSNQDNCQEKLARLESELQNLKGLFSGRRKNELTAEIESTRAKIKRTETSLSKLNEEYEQVQSEPIEKISKNELHYQCGKCYLQFDLPEDALNEFRMIPYYKDTAIILEEIEKQITKTVGSDAGDN